MKFSVIFYLYCYIIILKNFSVKSQLINGDTCKLSNGKGLGTCILLLKCPAALLGLKNGINPDTCGFEGRIPLVCCSNAVDNFKTISDKKCFAYNFEETLEIFEIVSGIQTKRKEFPHMAALGFNSNNRIIWQCGGSLVSEKFVLTAAHCLQIADFGLVEWVRLGEINLPSTPSLPTIYDHRISRRIPHPLYHSPAVYNDIALVELKQSVPFSSLMKPACLYTQTTIPSELIATGWGLTDFGGKKSETLQKVQLVPFTYKECETTYENIQGTRKLKDGILDKEQFCAGGRTSRGDTCQGDSGGPLQIYNESAEYYSIVGITSFGKTCGMPNLPGVYTRVSYYVPWLESIIWAK